MKKYFSVFLLFLVIPIGFSQSKKLWKGYFSYNEIKDLSEGNRKITAASENALFSKDLIGGAIKTTTTIDGLSGEDITSIYHSIAFKKTLVGYANGLLIVINDADGTTRKVVDIINKSISPNIKKINHVMEYDGIAYLSCDFGIVQYNLKTLEFGDTYFIGDNGAQISVQQTTIFQNRIYAATFIEGIRTAAIDNPNLNDFNQWTKLDSNGWTAVEALGNVMISVSNTGYLHRFQGGNFVPVRGYGEVSVDCRKSGNYFIVTTPGNVYIYNEALIQTAVIPIARLAIPTAAFTCATIIDDTVFVGTVVNGLFSAPLNNLSVFEPLSPDGPLMNAAFSIKATNNSLWTVYGGYDRQYNPSNYNGSSIKEYGLSRFSAGKWLNTPYEDLLGAKALVRIAIHPNNENIAYVSSYYNGLLKIENDQATVLYNNSNSGLESPVANSSINIRIDGTAFDQAGNLWVANRGVEKGLKVMLGNNNWQSYDLRPVLSSTGIYGRMLIDKNGTKWIGTRDDGIIGFNENYGTLPKSITLAEAKGELPSSYISSFAIDNRNQLWIGTDKGLRVLSSVDAFFSEEQMAPERIVIEEGENFEELMYLKYITDIVVDGSNNKWIGTLDAGVFYLSSDGQKTIYQFTIDNSPLPSNSINDIDINGSTGEVFFATPKGIISFNGISTAASDNLSNVFVYPNPVRPGFAGTVKISGLMDKANVKIADIEGNLVFETITEGGTIEWDTTAFGKYKVASGVYMILISAEDGIETKVKKVMIIR